MLLFAIGLLFLATAIVLLVRTVALPRIRMATHLRQIETYGATGTFASDEPLARPPLGQAINAIAEAVGQAAIARVPSLTPVPSRELASAGFYTISTNAFHGYRVIAAVVIPVLLGLELLSTGGSPALGVALVIVAAAGSWVLFAASIRHRSEIRLHSMDRELPELIDVLIATLEAGLGFAGSLAVVAGRFQGPLGAELRLAMQEQRLGVSTNQALGNILERSDTPAMRSFVRAVLQGETLGVSIGAMMRNLALEMRTRRRQEAQERVQKAPLKMLFPLIFLIFPSLLIVLMYPAVHELLKGFSAV
jgi:tight adherence protein C